MTDTTNLERQHQDFFDLIGKITIYKSEQQVKDNAAAISLLLSQLSGKLNIHITTEDRFLYPDLMNHTNPKVKVMGQAFQSEMGGLAAAFVEFKNTFMTASKISNQPGTFLIESQKVFKVLNNRIVRENKELYPLLSVQ